jgi:glycosyltransferase involved in cell wall biosynthesis
MRNTDTADHAIPFVSVVTPFYNTAAYLAECIESVLGQSWSSFEYLLVNNCSTDGSREIAAAYADRDPRIRLIDQPEFLSQCDNFNRALEHIAPHAAYCKLVLADDRILPDCLTQMVRVGEAHPTAAIVGAYYVKGTVLRGVGLPWGVEHFAGREVCRKQLLEGCFFFGSPTALLYRADLVRHRRPFFATERLHEDTDLCYEVLSRADFGFVHGILTWLRITDDSLSGRARSYNPDPLDYYIVLRTWGERFLTAAELHAALGAARRWYFGYLGLEWLRGREEGFWRYHQEGLATVGERFTGVRRLTWGARGAVSMLVHPVATAKRLKRHLRRRKTEHVSPDAQ